MTSSKPPIMNKLKSATARLGWIGPIGYWNRMSPAGCKYLGKTKDSFVCNWRFTRISSRFTRSKSAYVTINPKLILGSLHLGLPVLSVNLHVMMILGAMPTGIYPWEVQPWKAECERPDKEHPSGFPWRGVDHPPDIKHLRTEKTGNYFTVGEGWFSALFPT